MITQKDSRLLLGQRVRSLRKSKNLSQEELARISHVDRTYITSLENGHRNVSILLIQKICEGLGVSLKAFFNDELFQ
jgi:transcriptional regulator with XRE-family HTH domain